MHNQRLNQIRNLLTAHSVNALVITHLPMIRWAIGFSGSSGLLYVDADHAVFATDTRYATQAAHEVTTAEVVMAVQGQLAPPLASVTPSTVKRIGFSAEHLSVHELAVLNKNWPDQELVGIDNLFQSEISTKSREEVDCLERAQAITDQVFSEMLACIKVGMTEKEVAAELVYKLLNNGADGIPEHFWPIVASGPNSAIIHAHPTDRTLRKGDVLLLDYGCLIEGYTSDMTRTIVLGEANTKVKEVYEVVLKAQLAAIAAAKSGMAGIELDAVARTIVTSAGYEIPHGVGHSLGLEIHEEPRINPRNPDPLPNKAVMTIEPGIYIPGEFGIRIEDMILLEKDGNRNLTTSPKELLVL